MRRDGSTMPSFPLVRLWSVVRIFASDAFVSASPQLALTAASPAWRGYLADVDCRWNVIAGSVDDRTPEERGLRVRRIAPGCRRRRVTRACTATRERALRHPQVALRQRRLVPVA
jgi:hypothetical protein